MSKDVNPNWDHWIKEDDALTLSGFGSKRQSRNSNTKTKVDTSPEMKDPKAMRDTNDTKGFTKDNDPARHRPNKLDLPQQKGMTNPQKNVYNMWKQADLERTTREAQRRQNPNRKNYPWG
jgi:hypothetical protein